MIDIYIQELMHGNVKNKKNRFVNEIDREIDEILTLDQDDLHGLETDIEHRERIKLEMEKELEFPEIASRIQSALDLLHGSNELDLQERKNILTDLSKTRKIIDELSEKIELKGSLKDLFGVSDESIKSIFKLALTKLEEDELENSLSLFILLVVLVPENADYSYRGGIIAQMCEQIDLALKLYSACLISNPEIIEAKILSLDCYIKLGDKANALDLRNELNQYILNNEVEKSSIDLFTRLKNL